MTVLKRDQPAFEPSFFQKRYVKKILLLEDDRELASYWQNTIEDAGHRVVTFHTVDEAIAYLKGTGVDVVITDMLIRGETGSLSNKGGLTLLSHINLFVKPRPLVIAVTGASPDLNLSLHTEALNADHFVTKPVDPEKLLGLIEVM